MANLFSLAGACFMVMTYVLIFLAFFLYIAKSIISNIRHYFSTLESTKRQILSRQIKQMHLEQRSRYEKRQIYYRNEHSRIRLNRLNTKKQMRQLSNAIDRNLVSTRNTIPGPAYKAFKKALYRHSRVENVEGLLKLHLEITSPR
ncbi:MAG: hypothetical protein ACU83N_12640 [Gammaproteobacteria bacterium]